MSRRQLGILGALFALGCSSGDPAGPVGAGGGEQAGGGGGGGVGAAGSATGGAEVGGGGSQTAGGGASGASGASGSSGAAAYCGTTLAPPRAFAKTKISEKVVDYALQGAPGAEHHRVLLLLFNASTKSAATPDGVGYREFYTAEQLGDAYFSDPNGVAAFFSEASFGKVSLSGRVVGWLDQPAGSAPAADDFRANRESYVEQAASYATFADYDVIYIVGLTDGTDGLQVGWGLQNSLMTSQGKWEGGIDWMINSSFFTEAGQGYPLSTILPSRSWAHELHHTLAISGHDVSLDCGTATLAATCAVKAYGNNFSLMGESALGNHPSINMKQVLGWLAPGQLQKVTATTQVTLCPVETQDDKPKGLEIPLKTPLSITSSTVDMPVVYDRLIVEFRAAVGFDRYLDRLTDADWQRRFLTAPRDIRKDGVVITLGYADAQTHSTALLDLHPTLTDFTQDGIFTPGNVGKFVDAQLLVGETFELADQGIKIEPQALEGGGIRVNVTY